MTNLYLLNYNNYTDRIIKRESWTLNQIKSYLVENGEPDENGNLPIVEDTNFILNDALTTDVVVNWVGEKPNYIARVINPDKSPVADYWFVMGYKYNDYGQMTLHLKRDVIRTYWDDVVGSNAFIERGTPISKDDSTIYNKEDCTFNQVKTGEYPIKDEFGIPWVVGYIPSNTSKGDVTIPLRGYVLETIGNGTGDPNTILQDQPIYEYTSIEGRDPTKKIQLDASSVVYTMSIKTTFQGKTYRVKLNTNASRAYLNHTVEEISSNTNVSFVLPTLIESVVTIDKEPVYTLYAEVVDDILSKMDVWEMVPSSAISDASIIPTRVSNPTLYSTYNRFNKNTIDYKGSTSLILYYESAISAVDYYETYELSSKMSFFYNNFGFEDTTSIYSPDGTQNMTYKYWNDSYITISGRYDYLIASYGTDNQNLVVHIPGPDTRQACLNQPYHMFAIPLTDDNNMISAIGDTQQAYMSRSIQLQTLLHLTEWFGTDNLYDLQILPYCPCRQYFSFGATAVSKPTLAAIAYNNESVCTPITFQNGSRTAVAGIMLWCSNATTSFEIRSPIQVDDWPSITKKKISNETEMWRICSPGYSAAMEISPAQNDGITSFNIDMLATPYTPYIQVAPNFGGLYGRDFNDQRGMKSGDDISLPQISNAWTNYKIQNKNWLNQFNRQIENQQFKNDMAFGRDVVGIFTGGAQGAAAGGFLGKLGGGLIGAGVSMLGGIADAWMNEAERMEDLRYNFDMFKMQMENIQALPNTINKGSILSPTFKYFPFLETYSCTDSEKLALNMLIKFQGMKINRFGTIAQYLNPDNPYIRGFIVRYKGSLPAHIVDEINRELKMGVYLYGANPVRD